MSSFRSRIRAHVQVELVAADACTRREESAEAFRHLERAHVLAQPSRPEHVRVHWRMLLWSLKQADLAEFTGQILRIVGAAALGLAPEGNTGGTNVRPFARMPVPADLAALIAGARQQGAPAEPRR